MKKPPIYDLELTVWYGDNVTNLIHLKQSFDLETGFEFSLVDKDKNDFDGLTTHRFNDMEQLTSILEDFASKFDILKKDSKTQFKQRTK